MYDRNGLQLSKSGPNTLNSYYRTAVDTITKKYDALVYASRPGGNKQFAMFAIGQYDDPRDAAYVAEEFAKRYSKEDVRQLHTDGLYYETAREFRENIDIPEWKFPAEGLTVEDILGEVQYKTNYVPNARAALLEVINVYNLPTPNLKAAKELINKVEEVYETGMTYRQAAYNIVIEGK